MAKSQAPQDVARRAFKKCHKCGVWDSRGVHLDQMRMIVVAAIYYKRAKTDEQLSESLEMLDSAVSDFLLEDAGR